jgi:hypothetical protein
MNATAPVPEARDQLPHPQEVAEQWRARAALYPEPTFDDMRPDRVWLFDLAGDGTLSSEEKYAGYHVAAYQKRVVGFGPDSLWLQVLLSRELDVHPALIATCYMCEWN